MGGSRWGCMGVYGGVWEWIGEQGRLSGRVAVSWRRRSHEAGGEGDEDEHHRWVVEDGEGEGGHPEVDEDESLGDHGHALVDLRGEDLGVLAKAVARVLRHEHAAEEDGYDAGEVHRLRSVVGGEGERHRQRDLW